MIYYCFPQTMKGFVHSEKEKFERLAKEKRTQDEKLQRVMRMVQNTPSPGRVPLTEKDVSGCDS